MIQHGTVGFAISEITGRFLLCRYRTIRKAALNKGLNLITFEGRSFSSPAFGEAQQAIIYHMIDNSRCNSMIVGSSSVFCYAPEGFGAEFIKSQVKVPVASLNDDIAGITSVVCDNKAGILKLITHLVEEHYCFRIGFVAGPKHNGEARERLGAFKYAMAKYNRPVNPQLIFQGDFLPSSGRKAAEALVTGRLPCDALVFANDDMALGAIEYLNQFHPDVLERVAITGFDDVPEARNSLPQLTTASQAIESSSEIVIDILQRQLAGEITERLTVCDSDLKIRQTCGCFKVDTNIDKQSHEPLFVHEIYETLQVVSVDQMWQRLTLLLNQFSTNCATFVLFSKGKVNALEDLLPDEGQIIYRFRQGERKFQCVGEYVPTQDILPAELLFVKQPTALVVKPLCYNHFCYGYAVYDFDNQIEGFYESLHAHMCLLVAQLEEELMLGMQPGVVKLSSG